ncbi:MAG TPA: 2OG-Fe(II) oxygenase [Chloroflexota bacterium]|jgi:hypothetical protein
MTIAERVAGLDWTAAAASLAERGYAPLPPLLAAAECRELVALYPHAERFRRRIEMARHGYGEGDYQYFANPLPPLVQALREALYPRLASIANAWATTLGLPERYPEELGAFLARCHAACQARPTPLLLHYEAGGYNCLHQDLYGAVAFPLQVVFMLSRLGADYTGGELLLVEQRPRAQSRGEVVTLSQGAAVVFTTRYRPARGRRGHYRATVRHGVSRVHTGERYTLGIIFHDAA